MIKLAKFKLGDLFDVVSGKTHNPYNTAKGNTPFVSASDANNGISAYIQDEPTFDANLITISRNGSVCEVFFQPSPFCASLDDIRVLIPKNFKIDFLTGIYLCTLIKQEKFRYNYGRKFGTQRIRETKISLPAINNRDVDWDAIKTLTSKYIKHTSNQVQNILENKFDTSPIIDKKITLLAEKWKQFSLNELFDIKKGKRLTKEDFEKGETPFVGAIDSNNGWSNRIGQPPIFEGNIITVNYDGNGVAEAFYQPVPFWALDSVNVLYPKFELNRYIALFICTVIKKEKYRFSYGRKWNVKRMEESKISLPADKNGEPDFAYMEQYIKSLPYSILLAEERMLQNIHKAQPKEQKEKGLSDEELIKKYEHGKVNMKELTKKMLTHRTKLKKVRK